MIIRWIPQDIISKYEGRMRHCEVNKQLGLKSTNNGILQESIKDVDGGRRVIAMMNEILRDQTNIYTK